MKKKLFRFLMLAAAMTLGLASCVEHDNPVNNNPLAQQVSGLWWTLIDTEGTLPDNFSGQDYTRMGMAYQLNDDGTGYGVTFFFNDESGDPIYVVGGENVAKMTYTTTQDGRISVDFGKAYAEYSDYYKQFTVTYRDGQVTATGDGKTITLDKASDAMAAKIQEWDAAANGGLNPTSFDANTDFTASTWRSEEWIYIYDGYGTDHPTKAGFTIIPLPWNKEQRESNMSQDFCNYITPGNGWELALNYCGRSPLKNYNYFALYNKYTGILRFFTYIPQGLNVSDANDHMWQIDTGDDLSKLASIRYGIPADVELKDKSRIGQSGSGFTQFVTPWVNNYSTDGYVMPAAGWWAFDIDLSLYRPGTDLSNDFITLTMRSWNNSHVSLYSTVAANINGSMQQVANQVEEKAVCTIGGVKMTAKALKDTGSGLMSMFKGAASGNLGDLITGGIGFGKSALTMAGVIGEDEKVENLFNANISLQLDGNINTDGLITGSRAVVGVVAPSIAFTQFDTKNSHVGQGVWNLKTSPVVYRIYDASLASAVDQRYYNIYINTDNRDHPYKSEMSTYRNALYSMPTFLDPSSIEVELNPEVFPESQIEWMKVDAVCGWQPKNAFKGTDDYRNAYGLSGRDYPYNRGDYEPYLYPVGSDQTRKWNNPLCDFLYDNSNKMGMSYPYTTPFEFITEYSWDAVYGRGNSEYVLEPQVMYGSTVAYNWWDMHTMPALEVTVIVTVKMAGSESPYVLTRTYLPNYSAVSHTATTLSGMYTQMKENILHSPKQVLSELNEYQLNRLAHVFEWLEGDFDDNYTLNYFATDGTGSKLDAEGYQNLFDGKTSTKWCTNQKKDGIYFVEFYSSKPITPGKYYLTTANDTKSYSSRNPKSWKLMAKASEGGAWTTIATVTNDSLLPAENYKRVEYSLDVTGKQWKYFRFEISEIQSGSMIQLSEFEFDDEWYYPSPK